MKADYIIYQGEALSLSLVATAGDISSVTSVEAVLKVAGPNGSAAPITAPSIAEFAVSVNITGWDLVIDSVDTAPLKPGFYSTNAKLNLVSGGPLKTDPILIEIRASPS